MTPSSSAVDEVGAGRGAVGLAVAEPADVDVEQVDLRVGGDPRRRRRSNAIETLWTRSSSAAIAIEPPIRLTPMVARPARHARRPSRRRRSARPAARRRGAVHPGVPLLGQEHDVGAARRRPRPRAAPCRARSRTCRPGPRTGCRRRGSCSRRKAYRPRRGLILVEPLHERDRAGGEQDGGLLDGHRDRADLLVLERREAPQLRRVLVEVVERAG